MDIAPLMNILARVYLHTKLSAVQSTFQFDHVGLAYIMITNGTTSIV
jgi:hypothetical protein